MPGVSDAYHEWTSTNIMQARMIEDDEAHSSPACRRGSKTSAHVYTNKPLPLPHILPISLRIQAYPCWTASVAGPNHSRASNDGNGDGPVDETPAYSSRSNADR